jgi:hypothetical protein
MTPFYPQNLNYFLAEWLLLQTPAFLQDGHKLGVDGCPAPRYGAPHARKNSSCCGTGGAGSGLRSAKNIGRTSDHLGFQTRVSTRGCSCVSEESRFDDQGRESEQRPVHYRRLFRRNQFSISSPPGFTNRFLQGYPSSMIVDGQVGNSRRKTPEGDPQDDLDENWG